VRMKRRKKKEIVKKDEKPVVESSKPFETTDFQMAVKLSNMGFTISEARSPFAERKCKLYVFVESEQAVKEVLNGG